MPNLGGRRTRYVMCPAAPSGGATGLTRNAVNQYLDTAFSKESTRIAERPPDTLTEALSNSNGGQEGGF